MQSSGQRRVSHPSLPFVGWFSFLLPRPLFLRRPPRSCRRRLVVSGRGDDWIPIFMAILFLARLTSATIVVISTPRFPSPSPENLFLKRLFLCVFVRCFSVFHSVSLSVSFSLSLSVSFCPFSLSVFLFVSFCIYLLCIFMYHSFFSLFLSPFSIFLSIIFF